MTGQKIYIKDKPILTFFKGEKMKIKVLIFMFSLHEGGGQRPFFWCKFPSGFLFIA
jgi:hypothetical protein